MKSLRKILAVLTATAMVAGMGVMAFAGVGSITITSNQSSGNVAGKTFTAYRILDATYAGSGSGVTTIAYSIPQTLLPFYQHYFPNYSGSTQQQNGESFDKYVVDQIAAFKTDQVQAFIKDFTDNYKQLATGTYVHGPITAGVNDTELTIPDLDSGYYVIVDNSTDEPISALMLDTVLDQDVQIVLKANKEKPDKKILGPSGPIPVMSGTTIIGYLNEANELSEGSTTNFVVDEHVPNYTGYEYFYFILNDTLSKGLTYNAESGVKVYIDINKDGDFVDDDVTYTLPNDRPSGTEVLASGTTKGPRSETLEENKDYYVYVKKNDDGSTELKVAFEMIKDFPIGAPIRITYAANLNSEAITGIDSNKNEAHLEFSNRHNSGTSGTTRHDGPSGVPASGTESILDKGPKDWTDTYSTEILVKKTDGSGSLAGAQFTLTGNSTQYVVKNQIVYIEDPSGPFYMTKSGTYTLDTPTATRMDRAPSGSVSGYVEVTDVNDAAQNPANDKEKWVTMPDGKIYRPYVPGTDNGKPVYILVIGTEDKFASTVIRYRSGTAQDYSGTAVPVTMVLGGSGSGLNEFLFNQLGAGKYKISETLVPAGYNKAPDIEFEIEWEPVTFTDDSTSGTCRWTITNATQAGKTVTFTESPSGSGKFTIDVVNKNGVELPSTGGIGTTIFYAGGAILVLLAGILLVSKRRFA